MKEFEHYFEIFLNAAPLVFGGFGLAFIITHLAIPSIVTVAQAKMLLSMPNGRSSHTKATPVLGGIAIFAGLIISTIIFSAQGFGYELKYIIAGLIIIFFFGIKDDILMLDPKKKLAAQVVAALLIALLGDVRITNFHGFLGIGDVNYTISICCSVFLFIVLTNGFNLIDGIDGLASGVGIITSVTFGSWFLIAGHSSYAVMSFSLTGALLAFFYFNVFGKRNKIFLGDTGSLILGFSMTVLAIRFLEYKQNATGLLIVESIPAVTFGILIVPLFDTLRVFTLRIIQKKSPFHADKQHIHHYLLFLGFSHLKATAIILSFNHLFIGLSIGLQQIGSLNLILVQLTLASVLSYYMMRQVHRKKNSNTKEISMPGKNRSYLGETRLTKPDKGPLEHIHCPPGFSKEILKNEK